VAAREQALDKLRKQIKKAELPPDIAQSIGELQARMPAGQAIRCRSSTNNEDLEGFNGAGLYDSFTHRPDEGDLTSRASSSSSRRGPGWTEIRGTRR
jgi:hypothetical protein